MLRTRTELGELNGYSHSLPNPMLLLSPAVIRESVASSNIENINTTVERVLQMQLFPESEQRQPDKEVLQYREAMYWGVEQLKMIRSLRALFWVFISDSYQKKRTVIAPIKMQLRTIQLEKHSIHLHLQIKFTSDRKLGKFPA